jgi:hypothetical protein
MYVHDLSDIVPILGATRLQADLLEIEVTAVLLA